MRSGCVVLAACFVFLAAETTTPAEELEQFPGTQWEHIYPEKIGWSVTSLAAAEAYSQHIGSTAVVIAQHGRVVAEWGDTARKLNVHSIRKSLLCALIGIAVEAGQIRLNDTLDTLGIDDVTPSLTKAEKQATILDLLQARSGVYHPALYESPQMAAVRPPRGAHPHGTFWYYNNWDFNALGTIFEQRTKEGIFEAFEKEIAKPVRMQDYAATDGQYINGPVSMHPAYLFRLSARDLARFGLLYLHGGHWADRQIVPSRWVEASTRGYSAPWSGLGFGYLWWTGYGSAYAPTLTSPKDMYFAWGAYGQYLFVLPDQNVIVVHLVDTDAASRPLPNERQVGRLLWLILSAAGVPDIGPDRSLLERQGARLQDDNLRRALAGATLQYGLTAPEGPSLIRLRADQTATLARGRDERLIAEGSWEVHGDKLCRQWKTLHANFDCFSVIIDGETVDLFDADGVPFIEAHLSRDQ
jgi:CubicO group peptidase (beta-lactamase class C family)